VPSTDDLMSEDLLRTLLADAAAPPPPLTVASLVRDGRRRVRRRRVVTAVSVAALAVAVAVVLAVPTVLSPRGGPVQPLQSAARTAPPTVATSLVAPPITRTCPQVPLAAPAGQGVAPLEISPNGRYIVGHTEVDHSYRPVYWTDGVPRMVPYPSDAESAELTGVTNNGTAVGALSYGKGKSERRSYVARYRDGVLHKLPYPPGGPWDLAEQWINEAGDIMATVRRVNSDEGSALSVVWRAGSDIPELITAPADTIFVGIAGDGSLLGEAGVNGPDLPKAYIFDRHGRNPRELATPTGWLSGVGTVRGDWAVGGVIREDALPKPDGTGPPADPPLDAVTAAAWNLRTGELVLLPGAPEANVVGTGGWAVGTDTLLVLDRDKRYQLARPESARTESYVVTSVAEDGQIIGSVQSMATQRPVRWQC
jgi:hypothetical protein